MTRDEIAQAMQDTAGNSWGNEAHFQRFAALVIAAEREACAKVCEDFYQGLPPKLTVRGYLEDMAKAIRARGQDPMPLFDDWNKDWRK
jgi:hypothetical protein